MTNREKYQKYAEEITAKVIEQMNKGIIPWDKPFFMTGAKHNSYNSGRSYSLLNQFLLDCYLEEDDKREYIEYATFNAIKKAGGRINKGAKAKIIYELFITVSIKKDENGEIVTNEEGKPITFPRYTAKKELVFDIEKDTNLQLKGKKEYNNLSIPSAEDIINNYIKSSGVAFVHQNNGKAYYMPSEDLVNVPELKAFKNSNFYYSVAFHELTHSTGHTSRLNRLSKCAAFGTETYSKEELVAEIGAYTLSNTCGISTEKTERNSVAYLQSWIKALQDDTTLFVKAIQQATKAVKYILDCSEDTTPDEPDKKGSEVLNKSDLKPLLSVDDSNTKAADDIEAFYKWNEDEYLNSCKGIIKDYKARIKEINNILNTGAKTTANGKPYKSIRKAFPTVDFSVSTSGTAAAYVGNLYLCGLRSLPDAENFLERLKAAKDNYEEWIEQKAFCMESYKQAKIFFDASLLPQLDKLADITTEYSFSLDISYVFEDMLKEKFKELSYEKRH